MAKKKRKKEKTVFIVLEGKREKVFIDYLVELFDSQKTIKLKFHPDFGGSSDAILDRALKNCFYDKVFVLFDEDTSLSRDRIEVLETFWHINIPSGTQDRDLYRFNSANKNPIVIVLNPLSIEGILIQLFDKSLPAFKEPLTSNENLEYNKRIIKNSVSGIFQNRNDADFYRANLTKEMVLQKTEKIPELRLLLAIFE